MAVTDRIVLHETIDVAADADDIEAYFAADPYVYRHECLAESYALSTFTRSAGRPGASAWRKEHAIARRASGAVCRYWSLVSCRSIGVTASGLWVARSSGTATRSRWVFDNDAQCALLELAAPIEDRNARRRAHRALRAHLGPAPVLDERFPLLRGGRDALRTISPSVLAETPAPVLRPWLDAPDAATVARRAFGHRAYRKPLGAAVAAADPNATAWFSLFRGLVPTEALVAAIGGMDEEQSRLIEFGRAVDVRRILVRTPTPVLRRLLADDPYQVYRALHDAALDVHCTDLDLLPELIAVRGQRHLRSAADLEEMVRRLPARPKRRRSRARAAREIRAFEVRLLDTLDEVNQGRADLGEPLITHAQWADDGVREAELARHRDRLDEIHNAREVAAAAERERARLARAALDRQRAAWAVKRTDALHGSIVAGLRIEVAPDASTLARWGAQIRNCIGDGGYAPNIGLDLLLGLFEADGTLVLTSEITFSKGLLQLSGKRHAQTVKALGRERAQELLDALVALGVQVYPSAYGIKGLRIPQRV